MKKAYDVIVFDLGNTLIRFDHNISAKKIANMFHLDTKRIYDAFFDSEMTRDFEKGLISSAQFHDRAQQFLGIRMPYKDFTLIWNDIFWEDEEVSRIVRRLKGSYRLLLLSNVNRLHFEWIRNKFDIINIFDDLVLSYLVGAMKPDPKIYEAAADAAGVSKQELLYIDDREDLIKEATALGIDSIRFEGAEKLASSLKSLGIL